MWKSPLIVALLAVLVGCSRGADTEPASTVTTPLAAALAEAQAEYDRLVAQGPEKTAREVTNLEYPLYLEFMKFIGLEADLGGEEAADAWLRALLIENERRTNTLLGDLPKMIPVAYSGIDLGHSGAAGSIVIGDVSAGVASAVWERAQENGRTSGSETAAASSFMNQTAVEWSQNDVTITVEIPVENSGSTKAEGKIATRIKITTCPDTNGKVEAEFESNTELRSTTSAGTGGFIKITGKVARWLDDDANLIPDKGELEGRVEQTTFDNYNSAHVDVNVTVSTSTGEVGTRVNGRSTSATDETVQGAAQVARMGRYAAMRAIEQAKRAWESGRCVTLEPTTDPEKRTGADPGTSYTIDVRPRARSDGLPTEGTVRATLAGDSSLDPTDRIKVDAKFDYANPKEKDKEASIDFEARSKRGVGKASLAFDTKKKGYVIGGCRLSGRVPDVDGPFNASVSGYDFRFAPTGEKSGTWSWNISGAQGTGPYHITLDEDGQSGTLTLPPGRNVIGGQTRTTEAWTCTLTAAKD